MTPGRGGGGSGDDPHTRPPTPTQGDIPMLCSRTLAEEVRRKDATLFGTLGGPPVPHNDCCHEVEVHHLEWGSEEDEELSTSTL